MPNIKQNFKRDKLAVKWNKNEGTIGVVGLAPFATLDFVNKLYKSCNVEKDWEYPRVIIDNNPKIPSRGRYLELNEENPSQYIKDTVEELSNQGATVAVVACNTAHLLWEQWGENNSIPMISIIDAVVEKISESKNNNTTIAIMATKYLYNSNLYQNKLKEINISLNSLNLKEIESVSRYIEEIKNNSFLCKDSLKDFTDFILKLKQRGINSIVLGCTELSLLSNEMEKYDIEVFDSNNILANKVLDYIKEK